MTTHPPVSILPRLARLLVRRPELLRLPCLGVVVLNAVVANV